ncbi:hypothetical protein COV20_00630 [Candidatus Woesearchaeota archaeon CG10_big_fil_rev_8_21_14_0_10_45_16]|nr:MAG: hypothetical protein COV20_00630 [Candidatus Woesearchaeota archaeon CG10_big_fil_rev_8_21_14_0_10_45_16]
MQVTIQDKHENSLLKRTEVKGAVSFEGATPSNADVAAAISKQMSCQPGQVVVKRIHTQFSKQEATVDANVYATLEAKNKAEKMTKHLRKKAEEQKKKADEEAKAKAEAEAKAKEEAQKAAEKPAEENKEGE